MSAILIVEDDAPIRELTDVILTQAGHSITTASNGQTALEVMRRQKFDLVLLDVHMPILSGLEVLKGMRRMVNGAPPALMFTADRGMATVNEAVALGCIGYVAKPFTADGLLTRVRKALGSKRVEAPVIAAAAAPMIEDDHNCVDI